MSFNKLFHILFDAKLAILLQVKQLENTLFFYARPHKYKNKCPCCGCKHVTIIDEKERTFRGCDLGLRRCFLKLVVYKFYCINCKKKAWMNLPFTTGKFPMTNAFMNYIIQLNRISTLQHVARLLGLQWKTVKHIDKAYLKERPKQFSYKKLQYLSIDEIAVRKGHTYMTIVYCIRTGQIIWAGMGRKEENISAFLKRLAKRAKHLKGIAMDMSKSYTAAVKKHLPLIPIIFDRFHVTKVLTQMVDNVRKEEFAHLQMKGINVGKGDRFLFLRNVANLGPEEKSSLETLLALNTPLTMAHLMKEQFRVFWDCKNREEAEDFFLEWFVSADLSGIPALRQAAKTLWKHLDGLLNYFDHRINNGKAEGINNKIKTMKRQSYGFHDVEYFTLKLYNLHKTSIALVAA